MTENNQQQNNPPLRLKKLGETEVNAPFLYVAQSTTDAQYAQKFLQSYNLTTLLSLKGANANHDLYRFANENLDALVISAELILAKVLSNCTSQITLSTNSEHSMKTLISLLAEFGYDKMPTCQGTGEFSLRGDTVDIWQHLDTYPTRIIFFDNTIEEIKHFHPSTHQTITRIEKLTLLPNFAAAGNTPFCDALKSITSTIIIEKPGAIADTVQSLELRGFQCIAVQEEHPIFNEDAPFIIPAVGEIVLHQHHGLARYLGIKSMSVGDANQNYFILRFDGGTLLYVPTQKTDVLRNYFGKPVRLSRI